MLIPRLARTFPNAEIVIVPGYQQVPDFSKIDAAIWTLVQAESLAAAHPSLIAVVPKDAGNPYLLAYLMPPGRKSSRTLLTTGLSSSGPMASRNGNMPIGSIGFLQETGRHDGPFCVMSLDLDVSVGLERLIARTSKRAWRRMTFWFDSRSSGASEYRAWPHELRRLECHGESSPGGSSSGQVPRLPLFLSVSSAFGGIEPGASKRN